MGANWPPLVDWLETKFGCRGVLVYGSAASGEVLPRSDVDLLGLTDASHLRSVQTVCAGQALDLFLGSADRMAQMMERNTEGNGNFLLRALVHGRVLRDADGAFEALIRQARGRWAEGPSAAGERERRLIRARCLKISGATRRMTRSATHEVANPGLREVQLALFLGMLAKDFCRVHRMWASSLREMTESTEFGELQTMLGRYMGCRDPAGRLVLVERMSREIADAAQANSSESSSSP